MCSMKGIAFVLLLGLIGCDPDSAYIDDVKGRVTGGPVSACCGPGNESKGCADAAPTLCACVQDARITSTKVENVPGHSTERVRIVTMAVDGPHGKGTCSYTYGYGIYNSAGCKCESTPDR
jgi:hypothetical protein